MKPVKWNSGKEKEKNTQNDSSRSISWNKRTNNNSDDGSDGGRKIWFFLNRIIYLKDFLVYNSLNLLTMATAAKATATMKNAKKSFHLICFARSHVFIHDRCRKIWITFNDDPNLSLCFNNIEFVWISLSFRLENSIIHTLSFSCSISNFI